MRRHRSTIILSSDCCTIPPCGTFTHIDAHGVADVGNPYASDDWIALGGSTVYCTVSISYISAYIYIYIRVTGKTGSLSVKGGDD